MVVTGLTLTIAAVAPEAAGVGLAAAVLVVVIVAVVVRSRGRGQSGGPHTPLPEAATADDATAIHDVLPDSAGHLSAMGKIGSLRDAPPGVPANAPTLHPDKGPRASEIDGNPPLPPGEIKIRSLCCNQKMRNSGERLGKQRRCPKCGVAPFRYKIEPVDQSPPA